MLADFVGAYREVCKRKGLSDSLGWKGNGPSLLADLYHGTASCVRDNYAALQEELGRYFRSESGWQNVRMFKENR